MLANSGRFPIARLEAALRAAYGHPRHYNPIDPLDDLIFLVLSRMTQETKYRRTYLTLRERFPTWDRVADAGRAELEETLRDAGLAPTKVRQLLAILGEIRRREGKLDLSHLHAASDAEAEAYLTSLPGVGAKTALCVMLYALGRDVLPVDAHVWRIARRLGLTSNRPWSEPRSRELEAQIPAPLRGSLHVTLIAHGRAVCRARRPRCNECVVATLCSYAREASL